MIKSPTRIIQTVRYLSLTSCFVVNVLQNDPNYLHQGQDQSTKGQGAHVVPAVMMSRWLFLHLAETQGWHQVVESKCKNVAY